MRRTTKKLEFVESANISRCLRRISGKYHRTAAYRALFHAIAESQCYESWEQLKRIREALGLP
jgi:hypothetical protein